MRKTIVLSSILVLTGIAAFAKAADQSAGTDANAAGLQQQVSNEMRHETHERSERARRSRERHDQAREHRQESRESHEDDERHDRH